MKETRDKVLLLVDWDNIFYSIFDSFGPDKLDLDKRFERLTIWVKKEVGELWGGFGFVFAPGHLNSYHRQICDQAGLKIMICPKRQIDDGTEDTVDETIIWFGLLMVKHPEVGYLCLVSGDQDYVSLLERTKAEGVKIALAVPTINSLSTNKALIRYVDRHPITNKKMIIRLDKPI